MANPDPSAPGADRGLPRPSHDWALFLDLDGTLIDIAPRPDAVRAEPDLPPSLIAASDALGGALAIVSGRPVDFIDALLAPARLPAAGSHGAELRRSAEASTLFQAQPPADDVVRHAETESLRLGLHLERKPSGIVLHFRQHPALESAARLLIAELASLAGPAFEILPASMAFELRPHGYDKGSAVRALMRALPFAGRRPFFIGDDVTDDHGIEAARALGGGGMRLGVHVDAGPPDVRAWLASLPRLLESHSE